MRLFVLLALIFSLGVLRATPLERTSALERAAEGEERPIIDVGVQVTKVTRYYIPDQ